MSNLVKEYYELMVKDNKYLKKYLLNNEASMMEQMANFMQNSLSWRKIANYEELDNMINSGNIRDLLKIDEYYDDELSELLEQYKEINQLQLDEDYIEVLMKGNSQDLLNKSDIPQRLKDCINIKIKSRKICKELYQYLI